MDLIRDRFAATSRFACRAGNVSAALLLLLSTSCAWAGSYTVGNDADCSFTDLPAAITEAKKHAGAQFINIANNKTYSNEAVTVDNMTLLIQGGFPNCASSVAGTDQSTLHGANGGGPIFKITGTSHVFMYNLLLTGAQRGSSDSGGAIEFTGNGDLELTTTTLQFNTAGFGGGIDVSPSGGFANVKLHHDTLILSNTGDQSGGGIRVEGATDLQITEPNTLIAFNKALGNPSYGEGGGVEIVGPAHAEIGSSGYTGLGVIYQNRALKGGGLAVLQNAGGSSNDGFAYLFAEDGSAPARLQSNSASVAGGAAYLQSYSSSLHGTSDAALCAYGFVIDDNSAPDGAAVYLDKDTSAAEHDEGSLMLINDQNAAAHCPIQLSAYGAQQCSGATCNAFLGNAALDSEGQPSGGALVYVNTSSEFHGNPVVMRKNDVGTLITAKGDNDYDADVALGNCLIADNTTSAQLIQMNGDDAPLSIDNCTVAGNRVGDGSTLIESNDVVSLSNSIFNAQAGVRILDYTIVSGLAVNYVMSSETASLQPSLGTGAFIGTPTFMDAANGDYHLTPTSAGLDYAPANTRTVGYDLDGKKRNVDLPTIPNTAGSIDLGAYELQSIDACLASDTIFCNGFETP